MKSLGEILKTLDGQGDVDHLPFMPEMVAMCGREFVVEARADKTCDTIDITGCSREMSDTVHLEGARCDGSAHGGCQAGCLLFFKEEWLESAASGSAPLPDTGPTPAPELLVRNTMHDSDRYRCQATQLLEASRPKTGLRHWVTDVRTRNAPWGHLVKGLIIAFVDRFQRFSRNRLPDWARIRGGHELPVVAGTQDKAPLVTLDLGPGELVKVKSLREISDNLDHEQRNRGLWFDREMVKYCGQEARVVRRVERLIDEKTGRMLTTRTPSLILDGVVCGGEYHDLCPRRDYAFFREAWVERVAQPGSASDGDA